MAPRTTFSPSLALQQEFSQAWSEPRACRAPMAGSQEVKQGGKQEVKASHSTVSGVLRFAWTPIALHILLAVAFYVRADHSVIGYKDLGAALHFFCVMSASFFVALLAARSSFSQASLSILFMGGGALSLGLAGLATSIAIWGSLTANEWATIYRGSAFIGAAWHFAGSLIDLWAPHKRPRRPWLAFAICYLGATAAIVALIALLRFNLTPVFFVANVGATPICVAVTTTGALMFVASAVILCQRSGEHVAFRRWYGYGLALFAVSLVVGSLQTNMGDVLNWINRSAKSFGGVYLLIASLVYIREHGVWRLPAELALRGAEQQLRLANETLELALQAGRAGFFDWDIRAGERGAIYASPELEELLDVEPGALDGAVTMWSDHIVREDLRKVKGLLLHCVKDRRRELTFEFRVVLRGGGVRWLGCQGQVAYDERGSPTRMIGIAVDITGRKVAENALVELNRELERRVELRANELERVNAELEAFAYSVSHDLRTPLRAIHGFARVLLDEYGDKLDEQGRRGVAAIGDATVRMSKIIDDLLNFSCLLRHTPAPETVDLGELARSVFQELSAAEPDRRISFSVGATPPVRCDRGLMRLALEHLVSNSVRFTAVREEARIEVSGAVVGSEVVFTVRDNGLGFDMDRSHRLFGMFQRLHDAAEIKEAGTGIGLATVKRVLDLHGGRVWAEGAPGVGAAFHFALPAVEFAHSEDHPDSEPSLNPSPVP